MKVIIATLMVFCVMSILDMANYNVNFTKGLEQHLMRK